MASYSAAFMQIKSSVARTLKGWRFKIYKPCYVLLSGDLSGPCMTSLSACPNSCHSVKYKFDCANQDTKLES
jgi:hypothetical protein